MNYKEEILALKEDNEKEIKPGMVFNVRLSMAHFDKLQRPERNCILIADTFIVGEEATEIITDAITKSYGDISYILSDNEEVNDEEMRESGEKINTASRKPQGRSQNNYERELGVIQPSRLRGV